MKKDLISVVDVREEIPILLEMSSNIKRRFKDGDVYQPLIGKSLGMLFEKPSTRTRVSFEVAMTHLGGHAIYMSKRDLQLGKSETIEDTARVLSRYVDAVAYRAMRHEDVEALAKHADVPVINALDDREHPCQILSDLLTIKEKKGRFEKLKLAYIGDGNNVCHSLMLGSACVGMDIYIASPKEYMPDKDITSYAEFIAKENNSNVVVTESIEEAATEADIIYTDVWVSMGDEKEKEKREKIFQAYQVNEKVLSYAKSNCIVMHCLPAHRGMEITDEVIDGENSVVFDQAENRLHMQKAILVRLIG